MANVKKGNVTAPPQWWKHLRDWKRVFWKRERKAQKLGFTTASQATQRFIGSDKREGDVAGQSKRLLRG